MAENLSTSNFPTDNLYKFIALFGLALMITPFFFLSKKIEFEDKLKELKIEVEQTINSGMVNKAKELKIEIEKYEKIIFPKYIKLTKGLIGLFVLGGSISFWGFLFWYEKLQFYLDEKIKHEIISEYQNEATEIKIKTYKKWLTFSIYLGILYIISELIFTLK